MYYSIKQVSTSKELREFVKMQYSLYEGNTCFVPPMIKDEIETFTPTKNPALEFSEFALFMVYDNNKPVGRIALINNKPANKKWNTNNLRFGWIEFIEDYKVAEMLLDTAVKWAKERGLTKITGPHGFCDLDPQGMLVEGFNEPGTIASYYHHPYYHQYLERYGFKKETDYVEYLSKVPEDGSLPEKMIKTSEWVMNRYGFAVLNYKTAKEYKKRGRELFNLLEESFEDNYGTVPLSDKQKDYYINKYISFIHPELIKCVVNKNDEMIGFLITMPSLTKAYQKAKGKLLPTGIFELLKAMKTYETIDFYLAGVKKEYRGKGVDLIMVVEIGKSVIKLGFKNAESNQELETNTKVQAEWKFFEPRMHKRRRIYYYDI